MNKNDYVEGRVLERVRLRRLQYINMQQCATAIVNESTKIQNCRSKNNFSYSKNTCDVAKPLESSIIYFASLAKYRIKSKKVIGKEEIENLINAFNSIKDTNIQIHIINIVKLIANGM